MKLGRGVLLTLQRSSDEGHLAIAANMAKTPQPIITLTRSALALQRTRRRAAPGIMIPTDDQGATHLGSEPEFSKHAR